MRSLLSIVAIALLTSSPAMAQDTPRDLTDMVGARAGQAEGELQRRGYTNVGGQTGDDRSYTNWWNADRRQCVTIATMNGRYDSITTTPAPDCRQPSVTRDRNNDRGRERPQGAAAGNDLSRFCKGEAAAAFDRRPSEITTVMPVQRKTGSTVNGWYEDGKRTSFFMCRFDLDGRFLGVN